MEDSGGVRMAHATDTMMVKAKNGHGGVCGMPSAKRGSAVAEALTRRLGLVIKVRNLQHWKHQESEIWFPDTKIAPTSIMVVVPTVRVSSGQWSRYLYAAADFRAHVNKAVCRYHNGRLSNLERAALTGAGNDNQLREAFWGKKATYDIGTASLREEGMEFVP
ncbi:hypothetical protein B0H13DRAFT_1913327 [Mycena leptocephala]|nr:hypothetical protein B0H13DRAFT_1913327 [Mycena leptocephala]